MKNYYFKICANEEEMYTALKEGQYDMFIFDLALHSEKDGVQLIKELRQTEEYKLSPILVITAFSSLRDREAAMEAGATEYFVKPVDNKVVLEAVKYCINAL